MTDIPGEDGVKLYCPKCQDLYNSSSLHSRIDGAYFGTSFPLLFLEQFKCFDPHYEKQHAVRKYEPKLFGFRMHSRAEFERSMHDEEE